MQTPPLLGRGRLAALCADIIIMSTDAQIGYMPTRVWSQLPGEHAPRGWLPHQHFANLAFDAVDTALIPTPARLRLDHRSVELGSYRTPCYIADCVESAWANSKIRWAFH